MPAGTCRICSCTDARACAVGCSWVRDDLCSVCADLELAIVKLFQPRTQAAIVAAVLADPDVKEFVAEGDCDARLIRRALADLVKQGAIEKAPGRLYDLASGART